MGGYIDVMPVDKRKHYIASYQNGIFSERYGMSNLQKAKLILVACMCVQISMCKFEGHLQWTALKIVVPDTGKKQQFYKKHITFQ